MPFGVDCWHAAKYAQPIARAEWLCKLARQCVIAYEQCTADRRAQHSLELGQLRRDAREADEQVWRR